MARLSIRLQSARFNPGDELNAFISSGDGAGASASFTGMVRSPAGDPIERLTLEAYPEMAEGQMQAIAEKACARFELIAMTVIHRHGELLPGEEIVQVMALAPHRQAAFDAASLVMDWLKTDAPFWKKEKRADGENWVSSRPEDDAARHKWEEN